MGSRKVGVSGVSGCHVSVQFPSFGLSDYPFWHQGSLLAPASWLQQSCSRPKVCQARSWKKIKTKNLHFHWKLQKDWKLQKASFNPSQKKPFWSYPPLAFAKHFIHQTSWIMSRRDSRPCTLSAVFSKLLGSTLPSPWISPLCAEYLGLILSNSTTLRELNKDFSKLQSGAWILVSGIQIGIKSRSIPYWLAFKPSTLSTFRFSSLFLVRG